MAATWLRAKQIPAMDILLQLVDLILHLDSHLADLLRDYGVWIYAILFLLIFCETGLVVLPFLPGDTPLFVAGALAAQGGLDPVVLCVTLVIAAILGNTLNYWVGRYLGPKVFHWEQSRWFNHAALVKTHAFYQRHGGKTLVLSRFMPIIRAFTPFVAGVGTMDHTRFQLFNVAGGVLWVVAMIAAGYFFGNIPLVKNNLTLAVLLIAGVSLLPAIIGYWKTRAAARVANPPANPR
jgi:membrane-associated protein